MSEAATSATTAPKTEEEKYEDMVQEGKDMVTKLQKPGKTIDLANIEEGDLGESNAQEGERQVLRGFTQPKVKIHLLADKDIRTLATKRKFQGLFDIGVMSVHSANVIDPELTKLFKDKARVHCESADYLFIMKPDQRVEFRAQVYEKATKAHWTTLENAPYSHHMLFEVQNPEANDLPPMEDSDSSDIDLANF